MVHSPDNDTNFFDIVARDKLTLFLFIICLDYTQRTSKDLIKKKRFDTKKARRRQYPAETITGADYTDDLTLLANTSAQVKYLLHSL